MEEEDCLLREADLLRHIEKFDLNLILRPPTLSDGNCWYNAMADQVRMHDLKRPETPSGLRKAVCEAIPFMPEAKEWSRSLFPDTASFISFLTKHSTPGTWTDSMGIMCQATALYLGREVIIVGTKNVGQGKTGYTKLDSVPGSGDLPKLYVAHYHNKHFQSLIEVVGERIIRICRLSVLYVSIM